MSRSAIESPWEVGDKVYIAPDNFDDVVRTSQAAVMNFIASPTDKMDGTMPVFPVVQLRVTGVQSHHVYIDTDGVIQCNPVSSTYENTYKVIRNRSDLGMVVLISEGADEIERVGMPACKPFHDAFGPLDVDKQREIIYVRALNVDGHFKMLEVLDDQDW